MIRVLRPTDLLALAHFHRRAANLARSRDLLATAQAEPGTAGLLLADWRLPARRRTWVATSGRRLIGLVSGRRGPTRQSWEIDRLILTDDDKLREVCLSLLSEISLASAEAGVERLYLRLPIDHPVVESAAQAGFVWYGEELVLRQEVDRDAPPMAPPIGLRRREPADDHAIYRLYNQSVPARVRQAEAVTFQEWQALQHLSDNRRSEQWVLDRGSLIAAWYRAVRRRQSGLLECLYLPEAETELPHGLDFALSRLAGARVLWSLAPVFQPALVRHLQAEGFEEVARSAVFIKHLAVRARAPALVPVPA
ncbi:MAG TPA: hypothetical protein VHL09_08505 [Dehalococcoidia bacterium]|nr:hypothetical protein [Dehalococcoidia bacterium]